MTCIYSEECQKYTAMTVDNSAMDCENCPAKTVLSFRQTLRLKLTGRLKLPDGRYLGHCDNHGFYTDIVRGWEERLECPTCTDIFLKLVRGASTR